jgi:hypothetical protein
VDALLGGFQLKSGAMELMRLLKFKRSLTHRFGEVLMLVEADHACTNQDDDTAAQNTQRCDQLGSYRYPSSDSLFARKSFCERCSQHLPLLGFRLQIFLIR